MHEKIQVSVIGQHTYLNYLQYFRERARAEAERGANRWERTLQFLEHYVVHCGQSLRFWQHVTNLGHLDKSSQSSLEDSPVSQDIDVPKQTSTADCKHTYINKPPC